MSDSEKLDLLLSKMTTVEERMGTLEEGLTEVKTQVSQMATREDLEEVKAQMSQMATREDLEEVKVNMVTKGYLCTKMRALENSILREVDTVQEKSNAHYEELKRQFRLVHV